MTPGTPINFRPLWGLLIVLAGLCAVLFFACPLTAKHPVSKEIRIQHFTRSEQPVMVTTVSKSRKPPPKSESKPTPPAKTPVMPPQPCAICAEPTLRYLHAIQSPFPENRQTYEVPKVINNLPPALPYSPARTAAYAGPYENLHP
jgi:hypothetical protein